MVLSSGTRLGPYQISSTLGAGGMGVVYRARDCRLDRTVALKTINPAVAGNPDLKARLLREAYAISHVQHPHICALYDIGAQDGTDYLVMEYLEGETLEQRLNRGALPLPEALKVGSEIADGLDAAHRQGIVHRDLKPGNVMLTRAGAKLMDFGLAKSATSAAASVVSEEVTALRPITAAHAVVGTVQYMSPEQVSGAPVDVRSDIFSFGAVLYEMLTGKRPFPGSSALSVASAILDRNPEPLSTLQPITPLSLQRVVNRCLEKDPENRYQHVRDLLLDLRAIASGEFAADVPLHATEDRGRRWWLVPAGVGAVALAVGVIAGALAWRAWRPEVPQPVARTTISLAKAGLTLAGGGIAISPDGQTVVFGGQGDGPPRLYLRHLSEWEARPLPGSEGGFSPFFSPEGKWVAFFTETGLHKVPIRGGSAQFVCACGFNTTASATWGGDGRIIYGDSAGRHASLWSVTSDGGSPKQIVRRSADDASTHYQWPDLLPNGRAILFTIYRTDKPSIAVFDPATGEVRTLVDNGKRARYVAPGYLIYFLEKRLHAVPFDADRLEKTGPAEVIAEGVRQWHQLDADYDVSLTGTLAYVAESSGPGRLAWRDRSGGTSPLQFEPRPYAFPVLSPDGSTVVLTVSEAAGQSIWAGNVTGEPLTRLTFGNDDWFSLFSPDGKWLLFTRSTGGPGYNIFRTAADGSGRVEQLTKGPTLQRATSFSPGGDVLLFNESSGTGQFDVMQLDTRTGAARPFVKTKFHEVDGQFSPDGRFVAYTSNESGKYQVYVQPYPGPGTKRQISISGGWWAVWNPRGGELFYQDQNSVMSVRMENGTAAGPPLRLFSHSPELLGGWTVAPDGNRFLSVESAQSTHIAVVSNFIQELHSVRDEEGR